MKHVFLLLIVALFVTSAQAQDSADYSSLRDVQEARLDSVIGRNTFSSLTKTEYSYDEAGRIIREGDYDSYDGGGPIVWTLSSERLYTYNEEGELETLISGNPENSLTTETYNSNGLVVSSERWTRINWDPLTPDLEPSQRVTYSYDGNKLVSLINYSWSGQSLGTWVKGTSREYTYEDNIGIVIYYSEDDEETKRGTVAVNDKGDFTEVLLTVLNEGASEWINSTRSTNVYDENYNITLSQEFTWRENDWVRTSQTEYRYNENNQLYYRSSGGQVFEYTFNEDGYVETEKYSSNGFERITTYTYYFSNNGDNPTALTSFSANALIIANHTSGIEVVGTVSGTPILVYNLMGVQVESVIAQSDRTNIPLSANTIYVVKVGSQTFKIATR